MMQKTVNEHDEMTYKCNNRRTHRFDENNKKRYLTLIWHWLWSLGGKEVVDGRWKGTLEK